MADQPSRRTSRRSRRAPEPEIPLGSLTQQGSGGATCAACGSDRVTEISMNLTDGTPVRFVSCHRCEHRSWTSTDEAGAGEVLPVDLVLDKARKPR